jgi:hypothetical protein
MFTFTRHLGDSEMHPPETMDPMKEVAVWLCVVLVFGGAFAVLIGHMWEQTAKFLRFFTERDFREETGFKVMMAGLVSLLAGLAIVYAMR